mmetsp:Transcript_15268/g.27817  ORF Transcript_15268/g.27817 Transcript_15268/m.27817 type:complete len:219 (-) Transcript_15268:896-1552(-)
MQVRRYQGLSILDMLEALSLPASARLPTTSPRKLDFIAGLSRKLGLSVESRRAAFALALNTPDDVLSIGVCIGLASKLFDLRPISMKNLAIELGQPLKALLASERQLLHKLNYRVSQPSIHDWLFLLLELASNFVKPSQMELLTETAGDVADFLYSCQSLISKTPVALLAASAIQASLMLLTGMSGEFTVTRLLGVVLGEETRVIMEYGSEVFETVVS